MILNAKLKFHTYLKLGYQYAPHCRKLSEYVDVNTQKSTRIYT